jgi:hypothetical protein
LLVQGTEGGRNAARELISYTRKEISATSAGTTSINICIHIFANATNLAPALVQYNIISKTDIFHEFMNGFNSVDPLVTFVNVGRGKELTDTKVNGSSSFLKLSNLKQV